MIYYDKFKWFFKCVELLVLIFMKKFGGGKIRNE